MSLNVFLNSKEKSFGTTSDFEINLNLNNVIQNNGFQISVSNFTMPLLEYGISSKNNLLVFQENGSATDKLAIIDPGSYDSSSFMTALTLALEAAGSNTYSVTYNSNSKKITIDASPSTFKLINSSMLDAIGFEQMTSFSTAASSTNPINISGTTFIDIYTNLITNNYTPGNKQQGALLCRAPVNVSFGGLIEYNDYNSHYFDVLNDESISNLNIALYDDKGQLLELPDNCYCSLTLVLKYQLEDF